MAIFLTIFFWKPIAHGGYFTSVDVLQASPLFEVDGPGYAPANPLIGDPVTQMHPWLRWNRDQLAHFRLPTWNPFNGAGTPHLANSISAVFSPVSVPFYVLPFRLALIAAPFLKLFALGIFTYLFLRRVRTSHLAAMVGGVAFTYGAYNLMWVSWPQPGSAISLPAGLWLAEVALQTDDRRRARAAWAGFAAALACGLFAGHAETFFFTTVVVCLYVTARILLRDVPAREKLRDGLSFAGAGVLAIGVTAIQTVPFFEYLNQSSANDARQSMYLLHHPTRLGILHIFPDLFGRPDQRFYDPSQFLNYQDAGGVSVGVVVMFLGGVAIASLARRRQFTVVFFAVAAVGWAIYAYNLAGIGHAVGGSLPVVRTALSNFSVSVWLFAASVLAAAGVDVLLSAGSWRARDRRRAAIGILVSGVGVAGVSVVTARSMLDRLETRPGAVLASAVARVATDRHIRFVVVTLLVAVLAAAALVTMSRRRWARVGCLAVVLLMIFVQSGFRLRDYNPTVARRFVYPTTPSMAALKATVGNERTLAWDLLPPDVNLLYRVAIPNSYDAVGVADYDGLYTGLFDKTDARRLSRLLNVLGVRWVSSSQANPFPEPVTDEALTSDSATATSEIALSRSQTVSQSFTTNKANMNTLVVAAHPLSGQAECQVELSLVDVVSGLEVRGGSSPCLSGAATFAFPFLSDGPGHQYRAILRGIGAVSLAPANLGGQLEVADAPVGGHLVVGAYRSSVPELEPVGELGAPVKLFRVRGSPARYSSPGDIHPVATRDEARRELEAPGFDASRTLLVEGARARTSGSEGTVRVIKQEPTDVHLSVQRQDPGWVLALQSYYPGWKATVNGRSVPMSRANAAFSAVPVGAGTSDVVLRYAPNSIRWGLMISILSSIVVVALIAQPLLLRPRTREDQTAVNTRDGG